MVAVELGEMISVPGAAALFDVFATAEPGGGGTPIHYLYGYVPSKGVVILKLLI